MRHIVAEDTARCAPEKAAQKLQKFFANFQYEGNAAKFEITAPFEALNLPNIAKFSREVSLSVGLPTKRNNDTLLPLRWSPSDTAFLPSFEGYIEITPLDSNDVQLALIGKYQAPLGPLGEAFDAALGKHIALATVEHLVAEFKHAVELPG